MIKNRREIPLRAEAEKPFYLGKRRKGFLIGGQASRRLY